MGENNLWPIALDTFNEHHSSKYCTRRSCVWRRDTAWTSADLLLIITK